METLTITATTDLCIDCGHSHECWCSGERDSTVEASICCDCDKQGDTAGMMHPKRTIIAFDGTGASR